MAVTAEPSPLVVSGKEEGSSEVPSMQMTLDFLKQLAASVKPPSIAEVHEKTIAEAMVAKCSDWTCTATESKRLVRELLDEAALQKECHRGSAPGLWRLGPAPLSKTDSEVPEKLAAPVASALKRRPTRRFCATLCAKCASGDCLKPKSATGLTTKELVAMIADRLRRDERETGGVHCLCNRCMGTDVATGQGAVECKRDKPPAKQSEKIDKNMQLLKEHYKRVQEELEKARNAKRKRDEADGGGKRKHKKNQKKETSTDQAAGKVDNTDQVATSIQQTVTPPLKKIEENQVPEKPVQSIEQSKDSEPKKKRKKPRAQKVPDERAAAEMKALLKAKQQVEVKSTGDKPKAAETETPVDQQDEQNKKKSKHRDSKNKRKKKLPKPIE